MSSVQAPFSPVKRAFHGTMAAHMPPPGMTSCQRPPRRLSRADPGPVPKRTQIRRWKRASPVGSGITPIEGASIPRLPSARAAKRPASFGRWARWEVATKTPCARASLPLRRQNGPIASAIGPARKRVCLCLRSVKADSHRRLHSSYPEGPYCLLKRGNPTVFCPRRSAPSAWNRNGKATKGCSGVGMHHNARLDEIGAEVLAVELKARSFIKLWQVRGFV